jgi:hypothetical protein
MAVWRTKAYSLFGLKPGDYSYRHGKTILFADLVEDARSAIRDEDDALLNRIVEYVTWAAAQKSEELASVVDLAFFLRVFADPVLFHQLRPHFPSELIEEKWRFLMSEPSEK